MISIALCDDELKFLNFYESKIKDITYKNNIDAEVIRFQTSESLLFYIEDNQNKFDIIFLDIITGGINGVDAALKIREFNTFTKIIFLTSSKEYIYKSFEANPTNYLIKDLHDNKFETILLNVIKTINLDLQKQILTLKVNQEEIVLNLNNIIYIESNKRLVIIYLKDNKKLEFYYKISDLEKLLINKGFVLIQRSFLVNLQYIFKISNIEVTLKNNTVLPISRNLSKKVKETFINYLNGLKL